MTLDTIRFNNIIPSIRISLLEAAYKEIEFRASEMRVNSSSKSIYKLAKAEIRLLNFNTSLIHNMINHTTSFSILNSLNNNKDVI